MTELIFSGTKEIPENVFICRHLQIMTSLGMNQLVKIKKLGKIKKWANPVPMQLFTPTRT